MTGIIDSKLGETVERRAQASNMMASRPSTDPPPRPEKGDILLVIRGSPSQCRSICIYLAIVTSCRSLSKSHAHSLTRHDSVDDFQARSSDELSLIKGDHVELVERDDEFGDGWFLGRHLANGNSGLFPEGISLTP